MKTEFLALLLALCLSASLCSPALAADADGAPLAPVDSPGTAASSEAEDAEPLTVSYDETAAESGEADVDSGEEETLSADETAQTVSVSPAYADTSYYATITLGSIDAASITPGQQISVPLYMQSNAEILAITATLDSTDDFTLVSFEMSSAAGFDCTCEYNHIPVSCMPIANEENGTFAFTVWDIASDGIPPLDSSGAAIKYHVGNLILEVNAAAVKDAMGNNDGTTTTDGTVSLKLTVNSVKTYTNDGSVEYGISSLNVSSDVNNGNPSLAETLVVSHTHTYLNASGNYDFSKYDEYVNCTCTENGYYKFVCEYCEQTALYVIEHDPTANHVWDEGVKVAGNPTEKPCYYDTILYTCGKCGTTYSVVDKESSAGKTYADHTLTTDYVPAKEATATEDGNIAYYKCSVCGLCFSAFAEDGAAIAASNAGTLENCVGFESDTVVEYEGPDKVVGDVDDSGEVDTDDAYILSRYTAQVKNYLKLYSDINLVNADIDNDGDVDSDDAYILSRYTAKVKNYVKLYGDYFA